MATRSATPPSLLFWLVLAAIVVVADQVTKTLILGWFQYGEVRPVTSFFNLVRVHNTGAAFSFLADASGWQRWFFIGLGLAASAFIIWMIRGNPTQKLFCFAVTMIMGGALGNVIDRVVDFIDLQWWPVFNVADMAVVCGGIALAVLLLREPEVEPPQSDTASAVDPAPPGDSED